MKQTSEQIILQNVSKENINEDLSNATQNGQIEVLQELLRLFPDWTLDKDRKKDSCLCPRKWLHAKDWYNVESLLLVSILINWSFVNTAKSSQMPN